MTTRCHVARARRDKYDEIRKAQPMFGRVCFGLELAMFTPWKPIRYLKLPE